MSRHRRSAVTRPFPLPLCSALIPGGRRGKAARWRCRRRPALHPVIHPFTWRLRPPAAVVTQLLRGQCCRVRLGDGMCSRSRRLPRTPFPLLLSLAESAAASAGPLLRFTCRGLSWLSAGPASSAGSPGGSQLMTWDVVLSRGGSREVSGGRARLCRTPFLRRALSPSVSAGSGEAARSAAGLGAASHSSKLLLRLCISSAPTVAQLMLRKCTAGAWRLECEKVSKAGRPAPLPPPAGAAAVCGKRCAAQPGSVRHHLVWASPADC